MNPNNWLRAWALFGLRVIAGVAWLLFAGTLIGAILMSMGCASPHEPCPETVVRHRLDGPGWSVVCTGQRISVSGSTLWVCAAWGNGEAPDVVNPDLSPELDWQVREVCATTPITRT